MVDEPMTHKHQPEQVGETSQQGLRRMRRLAAKPRAISSLSRAIIHPTSGTLVHPAPPPHAGHIVSSLYPGSSGRLLPVPSLLGPAREISSSHDGRFIVLFHPSGEGGTLAIYPQTILAPYTTSSTIVPFSTLTLPRAPLSIVHLFPDRQHFATGLAAAEGPLPPPGHDSSRGPALIVLVPDALLLIHPHKASGREEWQMNVLKAPLHMRCQVRVGDPASTNSAVAAQRGWMGMVSGEEGVWVGLDVEGEIKILRVDVGVDSTGRWFLRNTPMPSLPASESSAHRGTIEGSSSSSLQGIAFIPLTDELRTISSSKEQKQSSKEAVAVVIISQLETEDGLARSHLNVAAYERRSVALADGFGEISGQNEIPPLWDWGVISDLHSSCSSPSGTVIIDLVPAPIAPPHKYALALLSRPDGNILTHIGLYDTETVGDRWSMIAGEEVALVGLKGIDTLVPSSSSSRGLTGLTAVTTENGAVLVTSPRVDVPPPAETSTVIIEDTAKRAAVSIIKAMQQNADWSDVVRATLGAVKKMQKRDMSNLVLKETFELVKAEQELSEMLEISRLQIALFGTFDLRRRDFASDMLRLQEAAALFSAAAIAKDDKVSFELDSVWPLIYVAEWVFATLAQLLREIVVHRASLEWDADDVQAPMTVLYAVNPYLRSLVLRLLAQVQAFTAFVASINRPILPPESPGMTGVAPIRDVKATALAKDRVKGMAVGQGVNVVKWGKALMALQKGTSTATEEDLKSLLELHVTMSPDELKKTLEALPNPSSLFMDEQSESEIFDRVTFMRLPKPIGAACNRCEGRTLVGVPGGVSARGGESIWETWKEERRLGCACGGSWVRG